MHHQKCAVIFGRTCDPRLSFGKPVCDKRRTRIFAYICKNRAYSWKRKKGRFSFWYMYIQLRVTLLLSVLSLSRWVLWLVQFLFFSASFSFPRRLIPTASSIFSAIHSSSLSKLTLRTDPNSTPFDRLDSFFKSNSKLIHFKPLQIYLIQLKSNHTHSKSKLHHNRINLNDQILSHWKSNILYWNQIIWMILINLTRKRSNQKLTILN
jgi:hypothetical protein